MAQDYRLQVRIPDDWADALTEVAEAEQTTISKIVRGLIQKRIGRTYELTEPTEYKRAGEAAAK